MKIFSLLNLNRSGHSKSHVTSIDKSSVETARLSVDLTTQQQDHSIKLLSPQLLRMSNDDTDVIIDVTNSIDEVCAGEIDTSDLISYGEKEYLNIENPITSPEITTKVRLQ